MKVPHDLPSGLVAIVNQPKALFGESELTTDFSGNLVDMPDKRPILFAQIEGRRYMLARDNQNMLGSLGGDIIKSDNQLIFVEKLYGDITLGNLAEQTIICHMD
jgi:hypothetical protein